MADRLRDEELRALREVEREGAPPAWEEDSGHFRRYAEPENDWQREQSRLHHGGRGYPSYIIGVDDGDPADVRLACAARNALPALLDEVEAGRRARGVALPGMKGLWAPPDKTEVNEAGVPTYSWNIPAPQAPVPEGLPRRLAEALEAAAPGHPLVAEARAAGLVK